MDYTSSLEGVRAEHLAGFLVDWPVPPSPDRHLQILAGTSEVVLAREETGMVAGFVIAVTDGVLAAYIPLLEVRRDRRGQGIGTELMQRMLDRMSGFYVVDLICDPELLPFYARLGLQPHSAAIMRNHAALAR